MIKVLSLFDGISCGKVALDRLGLEINKDYIYYASEIDKNAIKCSKSNHPDIIRIGDVNKVFFKDGVLTYEDLNSKEEKTIEIDTIDLLIGGSPCFVAGTQVITKTGYQNIENIKVGDYVLTHTNVFKKVLRVGSDENKPTLLLKAQGMIPTTTTYNHPYYVRTKHNKDFTKPSWKHAGELSKGDYIGLPINTLAENPLNLTEDECLVLGRYIADGHTRKDFRKEKGREDSRYWQLIISVGDSKLDLFSRKYKLKHSLMKHSQSTYRAVFSSKRLVQIAEQYCGTSSLTKVIPQVFLNLPLNLLAKIFEGYSDGDGCLLTSGWQATTVSKQLALSLSQTIAKLERRGSSVTYTVRSETTVIGGRTVNQNNTYLVRKTKEGASCKWFLEGDIIWYPVKLVTSTDKLEKVFNMEVVEDNSYTANNFIVHNCQSFSVLSDQSGLNGKSRLFYEYLRLLNEIKQYNPDLIFLLENVKMKKEYKLNLDNYLQTTGVPICSSLVSYQKRSRFYWSNKPFTIPEDKNISFQSFKDNSQELDYLKLKPECKSYIKMWANGEGNNSIAGGCANITNSDKIYCLTTKQDRSPNSGLIAYKDFCRYLTQEELEQAQTLPKGYTSSLSYNQACAVLGNGWTVDIIKHILDDILNGIN